MAQEQVRSCAKLHSDLRAGCYLGLCDSTIEAIRNNMNHYAAA